MPDEHDKRKRRCPKLGHEISFQYCKTPGENRICPKIKDCWWETFDIQVYLEKHYSPAELAHLDQTPTSKVQTIFDIMHAAQQRLKDS
ncbi:hypothetical protein ACFL6U_15830 [Planctomycetota bacterium]